MSLTNNADGPSSSLTRPVAIVGDIEELQHTDDALAVELVSALHHDDDDGDDDDDTLTEGRHVVRIPLLQVVDDVGDGDSGSSQAAAVARGTNKADDNGNNDEIDQEIERFLAHTEAEQGRDGRDVLAQPWPEFHTNVLSRLTFWWLNSLLSAGYDHPLRHDELWHLDPYDASRSCARNFRTQWTSYRSHSLLRHLYSCTRWQILRSGLLKFCYDLLQFTGPVILGLLIGYLNDPSIPWWVGLQWVVLLHFISSARTVLVQHYFQDTSRLGSHVRSMIVTAVYHKALKMSRTVRADTGMGAVVDLMSNDAQLLQDLCNYIHILWSGPLQIALALALLFRLLGVAMFSGLAVMILLIPLNGVILRTMTRVRTAMIKCTDERVNWMNEVLLGIRAVKLNAYEERFTERIMAIREREVAQLIKRSIIACINQTIASVSPAMVSLASLSTYALLGNEIRADICFPAIALFGLLRFPLQVLPRTVTQFADARSSLKRIEDFLRAGEQYSGTRTVPIGINTNTGKEIRIAARHVSATWNPEEPFALTNLNFEILEGQVVGVIGAVGAGKSSLLSTILGELELSSGSLPVYGSIAYVPQQAWIFNATLRENILFGTVYHKTRYDAVVEACALLPDLAILPAGDETEIGERGINLSGGQKQRISIARAIYSNADIILMDDPLSAVDANVGSHIFSKAIMTLLRGKTVVLVTHQLHYLPQLDWLIVLKDGSVLESGTFSELMGSTGGELARVLDEYARAPDASSSNDEEEEAEEEEEEAEGEIDDDANHEANGTEQTDNEERTDTDAGHATSTSAIRGSDGGIAIVVNHSRDSTPKRSDAGTPKRIADGTPIRRSADGTPKRRADGTPKRVGEGTPKRRHPGECDGDDEASSAKKGGRTPANVGTLTEQEERSSGSVKLQVYKDYALAAGSVVLPIVVMIGFGMAQAARLTVDGWLAVWSSQRLDRLFGGNDGKDALPVWFYITVYTALSVLNAVVYGTTRGLMAFSSIRSARALHRGLLESIFRAPMAFFEKTPIGRILNRFAKDQDTIDFNLPLSVEGFLATVATCVATLVLVLLATPLSIVALVPLLYLYYRIQVYYRRSSLELKRIESISRSPLFAHFSETLEGLSSIRAYGAQPRFVHANQQILDWNVRAYLPMVSANRWLGIRLDFICHAIVTAAGLMAVFGRGLLDASFMSLSISYAFTTIDWLTWLVRATADLEQNMNSVERVLHYSRLEPEAARDDAVAALAGASGVASSGASDIEMQAMMSLSLWPSQGRIAFIDASLVYREHLATPALDRVSFEVQPGERVGVCGRTGAGKSSLMAALFRLVELSSGRIEIDGINIAHIGLRRLRTSLAIIPQDPILFSGTLRSVLDPFDEYLDEQLWNALGLVEMRRAIEALPRLLEAKVGEGGQGFSVGQRQLLCFARALLHDAKILLLDEATASVDIETDQLIQHMLRGERFKQCTVITIAHRINTIIDSDRILVMSKGRVAEFDTPATLLANSSGHFSLMVAHENAKHSAMQQDASAAISSSSSSSSSSSLSQSPATIMMVKN